MSEEPASRRDAERSPHFRRAVEWALEGIGREYPCLIHHPMQGPADVLPPSRLTPVFFGCFDWHSAVHSHWMLVRVLRAGLEPELDARCRVALTRSFQPEAVEAECAYLEAPGREGFERPYGLAWLLLLHAELCQSTDAEAGRWSELLEPLAALARGRLGEWFTSLPAPIRTGEHSQSAFALGLSLDACRLTGHEEAEALAGSAARLHAGDRDLPLWLEPSAHDFLSPSLGVADLIRRVLGPDPFAAWLEEACPSGIHLEPATPVDRSDGKSVHLDGLNLSRAWMLAGIAAGLPAEHPERSRLQAQADRHAQAGLQALGEQAYEGSHWLGTFAVYLLTRAGLDRGRSAGEP